MSELTFRAFNPEGLEIGDGPVVGATDAATLAAALMRKGVGCTVHFSRTDYLSSVAITDENGTRLAGYNFGRTTPVVAGQEWTTTLETVPV